MKPTPVYLRLLLAVVLLFLVVACLSAGLPSQAAPQALVNVKLSVPMSPDGQVLESTLRVSADSRYVVYAADPNGAGWWDVFSARTDGQGDPVNLSQATGSASDWPDYRITPDSARVIIATSLDGIGPRQLYSVPITGGAMTKLNGPLVEGGRVSYYTISDDSAYVVYLADQDADEVLEMYSAPTTGGAVVKLNGPLPAGGEIAIDFRIDGSSSRVIYRAGLPDYLGVKELYSAPIAGGAPVRLNGPLVAGGGVRSFVLVPNATRVVYSADQNTDGVTEVFSVPVAGGAPVRLNPPLAAGRHASASMISPDGARVIYWSDQDTADVSELFSVPIGGGASVKLNAPLGEGRTLSTTAISDDSAWVVYRTSGEAREIYSVPISGGQATRLNGPLASEDGVLSFRISPDSEHVVYRATQDTPGLAELYSVPIGGGAPTKLNTLLPNNTRGVETFVISPDGDAVVYSADYATDEQYELYRVPISGGATVQVSGPMVEGGSVAGAGYYFTISPDGQKVLYLATQESATKVELFATFDGVPLPTPTPTTTTTPPTPTVTPTPPAPTRWSLYLPVVSRPTQ